MVNKQFIAQNRPAEKPAADMSVSLSGLRLDNPAGVVVSSASKYAPHSVQR